MENIQFIQVTPSELVEQMVAKVKDLLPEVNPKKELTISQREFLTRKETSELFKISLVTVHDWVKKGIIKPYKMGNKTYFKYSELLETLYNSNNVEL